MPVNSDSLPTDSRREFCLALKTTRERKGITLAEIAAATKIPACHFAALERCDLRRWPKGLFRRSFFRDYAGMIGVPVRETCAEFVRLFPDDEGAALATSTGAVPEADQADDVRLIFDPEWHGTRASVLCRLLAALIDAGTVILVASGLAWVSGMDRPAILAVVALAYFSLATVLFGESPAKWALTSGRSILEALTQGPASDPVEEPEVRTWMSDARRVGPSSLRVRIKLSH